MQLHETIQQELGELLIPDIIIFCLKYQQERLKIRQITVVDPDGALHALSCPALPW